MFNDESELKKATTQQFAKYLDFCQKMAKLRKAGKSTQWYKRHRREAFGTFVKLVRAGGAK